MCIHGGRNKFYPFYEKVDLIVCEFFVREVFYVFFLSL